MKGETDRGTNRKSLKEYEVFADTFYWSWRWSFGLRGFFLWSPVNLRNLKRSRKIDIKTMTDKVKSVLCAIYCTEGSTEG